MRNRIGVILAALVLGGLLGGGGILLVGGRVEHSTDVDGQPLEYWLKCIESDSPEAQRRGIAALPKFGAEAVAPTIARLGRLETQDAAARALAAIGAPATSALIDALKSNSFSTRAGVLKALDGSGIAPTPAVYIAVANLLRDDLICNAAAAYLLKRPPNTQSLWIAASALRQGSPQQKRMALYVLTQSGPVTDPTVVAALLWALREATPEIRRATLEHVSAMAPPPVELAPGFIDHLDRYAVHESDYHKAKRALEALDISAIPALRQASKHPSAAARREAVGHLNSLLRWSPLADDALTHFLDDSDQSLASSVAGTLRRHWKRQSALLWIYANSPRASVRELVANALAEINPIMWNELADLLGDAEPKVRAAAVRTARKLKLEQFSVPMEMARSPDSATRIRGLRLLPFVEDGERIALLQSATQDTNPDVVAAAKAALGSR